jgi:hypothetical protein
MCYRCVHLNDPFGFPSDYITQQSLTYNQANRISAKRMMRHQWFESHRETLPKKDLQKERAPLVKIGMSGVVSTW